MSQLTKNIASKFAIFDKKDIEGSKQYCKDHFREEREKAMNAITKQYFGYAVKTTFTLSHIILNKEAALSVFKSAMNGFKDGNSVKARNNVLAIANAVQRVSELLRVSNAVCLEDLRSDELKQYMKDSYELCSELTGFSEQEILNMRHNIHPHSVPYGVTTEDDETEITDAYLNYKEYVNAEDYIPALNTRIIIAYDKWVQGDAPNKFSLTLNSFNEIKEYFFGLDIESQPIIEALDEEIQKSKDSTPPLVGEDGNVRM